MADFTDPGPARSILTHLAADSSPTALRDRAIVECLAYAAVRWAELARLEVTAGPDGPVLVLPAPKGGPTQSAWMCSATGLAAVTALVGARRAGQSGPPRVLFASSGPFRLPSRSTFQRRMTALAAAVGVDPVPTAHSLRTGRIADLASRGASLDEMARIARHRSVSRIWDAYGHRRRPSAE